MTARPAIVLFGRTNVGKSTLFNRLTEAREALVSPIPGTTRDYMEGDMLWRGQYFTVIDTGGVEQLKTARERQTKTLSEKVREKITQALQRADLVLFLIDAKSGVTGFDRALLKFARGCRRPMLVVANKTDNNALRAQVATLPFLGGQPPIPISAVNGSGVGDMLDIVVQTLNAKLPITNYPPKEDPPLEDQLPNAQDADIVVTILGKPNVGKSSLLNAILGEERVIVDARPHTTREPIDTVFRYKDKLLKITDTAGIRRHVGPNIEKMGVERTLERLKKTDVVVLLLDPFSEALSHQDRALAGLVKASNAATILVANKYDLNTEQEPNSPQILGRFERLVRTEFPFFSFAPLLAISAKQEWRVKKLLDMILAVDSEKRKELDAETLKNIFTSVSHELGSTRVRTRKTRRETPKLGSLKQTRSNLPEFAITTTRHGKVPFSIVKIIEKHIRDSAGFVGAPIKIHVVRK